MVKIELVNNKEDWDKVAQQLSPCTVLQSWDWGEFQVSLGRKIWRLGIYNDGKLIGVALAQLIPTKLRTHIYISNGPALSEDQMDECLPQLLGYLKALGIQEKVQFVRIDPLYKDSPELLTKFKGMGLKRSATYTQSENKWLLDVTKPEEQLLNEMRKSTRYEIRKAQKEGVVVTSSTDIKDYEEFEKLFIITTKRQNFIPHPLNYYKQQFETLSKGGKMRAYTASKDGQVLATALISFYGDTASYLHAASLSNRDVNKYMAPPALVWKAIQDTKEYGLKYFDFWGIALTDNPKHPWAGFTRFKKGFGGFLYPVVRAHDIPISPRYPLIQLLDATREIWGLAYYKVTSFLSKFKKETK